jgi:oxygen-independent coproporphyrinogen-3 oxidase
VLSRGGFARYEISAYALPGARARHNLNYWQFGDYLGVGAGAHGKRSDAHSGTIVRTVRPREPRRYMAECDAPIETTPIDTRDRPFEFMLNALRLVEGFDEGLFEARTGLEWSSISPLMAQLRGEGLTVSEGESWGPSARGLLFLNDLLVRFLPSARDYSQAASGST